MRFSLLKRANFAVAWIVLVLYPALAVVPVDAVDAGLSPGCERRMAHAITEGWSAALRINSGVFSPGDRIMLRVFNGGTVPISFGEGVSVKVRRDGTWRRSSAHFRTGPVRRIAFVLFAGEVSACETLRVPSALPAGRYRFEKRVRSRMGDREETLSADFVVGR